MQASTHQEQVRCQVTQVFFEGLDQIIPFDEPTNTVRSVYVMKARALGQAIVQTLMEFHPASGEAGLVASDHELEDQELEAPCGAD
ncbi:MAG TPA: hypothetical protein VGI81_18730 [Tepidisphaeraceae bacterium]|jgi:hypothetical protein